ncbi:MAG: endolytic transglycosylase MltG [Patescibacteria group bacterium]
MKRLIKYFLITAVILLATALIIGLFYIRCLYQNLIVDHEKNFPAFVTKIIDKFTRQPAPPVAVVKTEDTIQILEGWTDNDIEQYFVRQNRWPNEEFFRVVGQPQVDYRYDKNKDWPPDFSARFSFLVDKPKYYGLEGYLFPDTYRIYADSTAEEVVEKMLDNFDKKLTPAMRADIKKQGKTIYQIITMASIIEKEAPIDYQKTDNRDARIISGIFWNRLKIGQALQSDATLSYILNDNQPQHSGKDLVIDSPYNTYKYRGLPPGPICNPGILAIKAAIYPLATDYYYFLTPKGKDEVIYAHTNEEHNKNKNQYLR